MKQKALRTSLYGLLILFVVVASFLAGNLLHPTSTVRASSASTSGEYNPAGVGTHACYLDQIDVFDIRFHVHCTQATADGISYFTYSTQAPYAAVANRMLMLANTAFSLGKPYYFGYDTDASHNLPGCFGDCRNLVWVRIGP